MWVKAFKHLNMTHPTTRYTGSVFEQMTRTTKGNVLKEGSVDRLNKVEIQTPRTPFFLNRTR